MANFAQFKDLFSIPKGTVYLCGNSLGPPLKSMTKEIKTFVEDEWAKELVKGWNSKGWFSQAKIIGNQISKIVGAPMNSIIVGDTLSTQVFQALTSALKLNSKRKYILTDNGNFPADVYIAQGLLKLFKDKYEIKIVDPEKVMETIDEDVAVVMLTQVDYRTSRLHDMKKVTEIAHKFGALTVWDLAHSAGVLPISLENTKADFAVGCTYKYLNGGPGSPAFIYVAPKYINEVEPALFGWHGHKSPFDFSLNYEASMGIDKMRIGSPSIISFSALRHSLDIWEDIDLSELRKRSIVLSELFISELDKLSLNFKLACPRDPNKRGGQISYICENGYEFMQAFIGKKLIGDFRAPNLIRFGFSPLYLDENDILKAIKIIDQVSKNELWKNYKNINRKTVT